MITQGTNILKEQATKRLNFNSELKQINFLDRRLYKRSEDLYYPSVTTILQYMPKSKFFESWLKEVGFNADTILAKAGKEGTQTHNAIEDLVLGREVTWIDDFGNAKYSLEVWEMIMKFVDFWTTHKPTLISSEEFVYSDEDKYAGTADLLVEIEGEVWLLDIKTSNALHKSYDLQLAAYAKAFKEVADIDIHHTGILWLKAATRTEGKKKGVYQGKGWQIKQVDEIDENFRLFKLIQELYNLDNPTIEPLTKTYPTVLKL